MKKGLRDRILKSTLITIIVINFISLSLITLLIINNVKENTIKETIELSENIKYILRNTLIKKEPIYEKINDIYYLGFDYVGLYKSEINNKQSIGSILDKEDIKSIYTESNNLSSLIKSKISKDSFIITYNYPIYEDKFIGNLIVQKNFKDDLNEGIGLIKILIINQTLISFLLLIFINKNLFKIVSPIIKLKNSMTAYINGKEEKDFEITFKDEIYDLKEQYLILKDKIAKDKIKERDFLSNSTHELKTPITAIYTYAQLLENNKDEEFNEKAINRILLECKKEIKLIENLLILNKRNYNYKNNEKLNIRTLIKEILEEDTINNIKINFDIEEDFYIEAIKEDIDNILRNLIDNAIKYTTNKTINIKIKGGELEISNKILSIPEDLKDRLFDPFIKYIYKKETFTSSGMGLYIAKELSENNNLILSYDFYDDIIRFKLRT